MEESHLTDPFLGLQEPVKVQKKVPSKRRWARGLSVAGRGGPGAGVAGSSVEQDCLPAAVLPLAVTVALEGHPGQRTVCWLEVRTNRPGAALPMLWNGTDPCCVRSHIGGLGPGTSM